MVDLKGQYNKIKNQIDTAVIQTIESTGFINGPIVKEFSKSLEKFLGVKHVIPCANGTDALQIALMALSLKPGDEVICPSFTYVATAEVISLLGLTPVMTDVDPDTFNITADIIRPHITSKTKAIVPVHLYGQSCDMEGIMDLAKEFGLYVIEDNAQAIGAKYTFSDGTVKNTGTIGHIGTTSFFPSKNLGCYGDGGAIFTNDDDLAHAIRGMVNHGMYKRYYHDVVGVNSRLDSIQAAVLKTKLPLLDKYCDARRDAARYYNNSFSKNSNIITPTTKSNATANCGEICDSCDCHVFHQYTIKITNGKRDELHQHLLNNGIPNAIYYPVPLHAQKAYQDNRYQEDDFTTTNELIETVISLPMHTELDKEQLTFITKTINDFVG